jgi:WD40 repeat protein
MFWDINKKICLISKNLGTQATCLDFSPDGRYLAIGLNNGVFMVLESYIERLSYGTYMEEYIMPTLSVIMCPKESNSSIVNIKYSFKGDFLAVSYNNEFKLQDQLDEAEKVDQDNPLSNMKMGNIGERNQYKDEKREPAFGLIFVNRQSSKSTGRYISKDPYVKMQKILIRLEEYVSSAAIRNKMAITKMDFSEDDRYLETCAQVVDQDNNIQLEAQEDIYIVWDISIGKFVQDLESLRYAEWPDWSLSSSLNARYVNKGFDKGTDEEEKRKFILEACAQTAVGRFTMSDNALCGSNFGELFAFRYSSLKIDKNQVMDFYYDRTHKRDMALCKGFDALTSMILSINVFEDKKVFVTGNND